MVDSLKAPLFSLAVALTCAGACGGTSGDGAGADLGQRPAAADPVRWRATGSLTVARTSHTATLLPDGRVLVVGGQTFKREPLPSVELFDPQTETWTMAADLPAPRSNHSAARLPDGRVLIFGGGLSTPIGVPSGQGVVGTTLLFDPSTNTFSQGAPMLQPRSHFPTVTLPDGSVLAVGGGGDVSEELLDCGSSPYCGPFAHAEASAERYDPKSASWSAIGALQTGRSLFTVTALPDGGALAAGGVDAQANGFPSTERLDPATRTWSAGPELLGVPRMFHAAAATGLGNVLVVGGKNPNVKPLDSAQRLDVQAATWSYTPKLSTARTAPGLVTLESGRVLQVGGYNQFDAGLETAFLAEASIYDDAANAWTTIEPLAEGRMYHTVTRLLDGRLLVVGGAGNAGALASCELSE